MERIILHDTMRFLADFDPFGKQEFTWTPNAQHAWVFASHKSAMAAMRWLPRDVKQHAFICHRGGRIRSFAPHQPVGADEWFGFLTASDHSLLLSYKCQRRPVAEGSGGAGPVEQVVIQTVGPSPGGASTDTRGPRTPAPFGRALGNQAVKLEMVGRSIRPVGRP
jgi:hypothetical protein